METDFEAAMDLLQKWEKDGTLKLHTLAQPMFKSAVGDPQRFVDFGVKMNKKFNSEKLRVSSLKIHPEGGYGTIY